MLPLWVRTSKLLRGKWTVSNLGQPTVCHAGARLRLSVSKQPKQYLWVAKKVNILNSFSQMYISVKKFSA